MVDDSDAAWHAGNLDMNKRSIGIEHAADEGDRIQAEQEKTSVALIRWLIAEYSVDIQNILPHDAVHSTSCPGQLFADYGSNHSTAVQLWLKNKVLA